MKENVMMRMKPEQLRMQLQSDLKRSGILRQKVQAQDIWAAIINWHWPLVMAGLHIPLFLVLDIGFGFREDMQMDERCNPDYKQAMQSFFQLLCKENNLSALYTFHEVGSNIPWSNQVDWQARQVLTQACACVLS